MTIKNSTPEAIEKAMLNGGVIYVDSVRVFIDSPNNFEDTEVASGFWILNAMGWKTYFKNCSTRPKAQKACDTLYGVGAYKVNSKI